MTVSTMDLANTYAKYFVHDFAVQVMGHLKGSHPIPEAALEAAIEKKLGDQPNLAIQSSNAITRFLYECADHVLKNKWDNPAALESWQEVSSLPSVHHADISRLVFNSADLYRKTLDQTVMGVIAKDAYTTSAKIAADAQARIQQTETGGEMHLFSWGILNDGLWLNSALMRAYDLAKIFRPGDQISTMFARVAFDFARQKAGAPGLDRDEQMVAYGETDLLVSQIADNSFTSLLNELGQNSFNSLLFTNGALANAVHRWELGLTDPTMLVGAVDELSKVARILQSMVAAPSHLEDRSLVSDLTVQRLNELNDVVTLCLVGFEALRSTKYNESLIMSVLPVSQDNKVDVIVNNDTFQTYRASGGQEGDFVKFGLYLDPRRGMVTPSNGYSMQFVLGRRDDVIPQMMAEDADRISTMRDNDAQVIQDLTIKTLNGVTKSYCEAKGLEAILPSVQQKIYAVSRNVVRPSENFALESGIMDVLLSVMDDGVVTNMTQHFVTHMGDNKDAPSLTILSQAMDDAIDYVTTSDIVEEDIAA